MARVLATIQNNTTSSGTPVSIARNQMIHCQFFCHPRNIQHLNYLRLAANMVMKLTYIVCH